MSLNFFLIVRAKAAGAASKADGKRIAPCLRDFGSL